MNALNTPLIEELNSRIDDIEADPKIRVTIITGTAGAFCAGADLKEITNHDGGVDPEKLLAFVRQAGAVLDRIAALKMPVIAAVNGTAAAGGLELALACDLVIAAESARLGDAHSNYGLLPGAGGAARLARVVGPTVAKYLAFTGDLFPAKALMPFGLVNEVVADARLDARVGALAAQLAAKSRAGLARMKILIDDGLQQPLPTALRLEQQAIAAHVHSGDVQEGLAAFREKREPRYPRAGP